MESFDPAPEIRSRVKKTDWRKVIEEVSANPEEVFYIGLMDQSIRTHIKNGRIKYLDPALFNVWTEKWNGNQARLYMQRKK
jgi:hypothetical protein